MDALHRFAMRIRGIVFLLAALGALLAGLVALRQEGGRSFGDPIEASSPLSIPEVLLNTEAYLDRRIVVEGRIGSVCQTAGCWCVLEGGSDQLYVSLLTFALPRDVAGRSCRAAGRLVDKDGSLALLATGIDVP